MDERALHRSIEPEPDAPALVAPQTLAERAYRALSRMIQERHIKSGEPIVELHLAERLGVSRTPLRQALQRLEGEGLLRKREGRSYVLRKVELREYLQSLKVREILEAEAAALAVGRTDPADIQKARATLRDVEARVPYDMLAHWQSDDEVHCLFIDGCGNAVLRDMLHALRVTTKLFEIDRLSERLEPDSRQHEAILDALAEQDASAARAAVVAHMRSLFDFAVRVL